MMPVSAQYKMDQLVSLMMAEDKIEPSEQFVTVLKTLNPAEVIIFLIYKHRKNCECCPGHYLSTSVY